MLKKMIDGKEHLCSPEEEASIRARWKFHDTYPEYSDAMMWDERYSGAFHDQGIARFRIDRAIELHRAYTKQAVQKALEDTNKQIEVAQEHSDTSLCPQLIQKRKEIRAQELQDLSSCSTLEHLRNTIHPHIRPFWPHKL